jgi:hypothetical protein
MVNWKQASVGIRVSFAATQPTQLAALAGIYRQNIRWPPGGDAPQDRSRYGGAHLWLGSQWVKVKKKLTTRSSGSRLGER